jgi:hypothetical protein
MVTLPLNTAPPEAVSRRRRRRGSATLVIVALVVGLAGIGGWAWWNGTIGNVTVRDHCTAVANGTATEVDPEQAGNAAIISSIAVRRELPARAASIGIATAIQESKLTNIEFGDRDSLGLFQQRPSQGWGTPEQILDPVYSTEAFYDALVKVDGYEDMVITEVAQKVQRSAYPDAYADHEPEGRILASALSGYSPNGFSCVLRMPDALPAERAGEGGLTPRAQAVAKAASREAGRRAVVPVGDDGTTLRVTAPATENNRLGWSLAHWAVARAHELDIVAVDVGDRRWLREESADGWTSRDGAMPAGVVEVRVG